MPQNIVEYALKIDTKTGVASLKAITNESKKTEDQFDGLSKQSKKTGQSLDDMAKDAAVSALALLELGKRALKAVGAIISLGQVQADLVNDLNDLSTRSGIAAETIKGLQLAFMASGQEASQVKQLLDKMPVTMSALANGTGAASKALKKLGLDAFDSEGNLKSSQVMFEEITTELQKLTSGTEKAAIASDIFGRQAGNMLQAFGQTEGLSDFMAFTQKWGTDIGPEASEQAAKFQQAMAALNLAIDKLSSAFASAFGEDGFVSLVKAAGQAIIFFATLVTSAVEDIQESFETMKLNIKESVLEILIQMETLNADFRAFIGDTEGFTEVSQNIHNLKKELDGVQDTLSDRRLDMLADIVNGQSSSFKNASEAAKEYGDDLEELMRKIGTGRGGSREGVLAQQPGKVFTGISEEDFALLSKALDDFEQEQLQFWTNWSMEGQKAMQGFEQNFIEAMKLGVAELSANLASTFGQVLQGDLFALVGEFGGAMGQAIEKGLKAVQGIGDIVLQKQDEVFQKSVEKLSAELDKQVELGLISEEQAQKQLASQTGRLREEAVEKVERLDLAEQEIKLNIENQVKAFSLGLALLPSILIKHLPGIIVTATKDIVKAITLLPIHIGKALVEGIARIVESIKEFLSITNKAEKAKKGIKSTAKDIGQGVSDWFEDTWSFYSGGRIPFAQSGIRFTGSTGLAMLHRNETVVPESGQASQAVQRDYMNQVGGQGMTININSAIVEGNAVDALVRQIEQRFRAFGSSTSPLFTGY